MDECKPLEAGAGDAAVKLLSARDSRLSQAGPARYCTPRHVTTCTPRSVSSMSSYDVACNSFFLFCNALQSMDESNS